MTPETVTRALRHVKHFCRPGQRLLDACYGPQAKPLRTSVLAILFDRKVTGSDKQVQWGNFRKIMLNTLDVTGNCIANEDASFEEKAKEILN